MNTKLQNFTNTLSNLFLLCLGLLAFQSIFGQAIFGFNMADYSIGSFLLGFIQKVQYMLVILAIVFGSLIFYSNREDVESLEEEKEREEGFFEKYNKKDYLILFFIYIIFFINTLIFFKNQVFHVDDVYTYSAIIGENLHGIIKYNLNGIYYEYPKIYLYLVNFFYNIGEDLGFNKVFSLRLFNFLFTQIIFFISFIVIKNIKLFNKKYIFLFLFLLAFNTPIIASLVTARVYPFNILTIIISIYLLFLFLNNKISEIKYYILLFSIIIFSWIIHPVNTIHILILLIISILFSIKKHNFNIKIILFSLLGFIFISGLILLIRPDTIDFALSIISSNPKIPIINYFLSLYGYYHTLDILILGLFSIIALLYIYNYRKNFFLGIFLFVLINYLMHNFLIANRTDNIRYVIEIIYILFLINIYIIYLLRNSKLKFFSILYIIYYLTFNIYIGYLTINKDFSWYQMRNPGIQEKIYLNNNKFYGKVLITDYYYPNMEKYSKVYLISSSKNSILETVQKSIKDNKKILIEYRKKFNINNFNDYKTGLPYIKNLFDLKNILNQNKEVYILVGFTFFDNWHIDKEKKELRTFILKNCKNQNLYTIKKEFYIDQPLFWKYNNQLGFYCKFVQNK